MGIAAMTDIPTHIYVQARMESTRLPGKVLKPVLKKPLLEYLLERVSRSKEADAVVVLTSTSAADDPIEALCQNLNVNCFRGPLDDVLARFYLAAELFQPNAIVRITADCPLIDPEIINMVIKKYKKDVTKWDYVSNTVQRKYARGMDVELFSKSALDKAHQQTTDSLDREHVTRFMYRHPNIFQIGSVEEEQDHSHLRLTVDTEEDFQLIKHIIETLYPKKKNFTYPEILALLKQHPKWLSINSHIPQRHV